jgi:cysteine desulfurase / selenocysteine lyase
MTRAALSVDLRDLIVGGRTLVPVMGGGRRPFVNLDNAASTPIARAVKDKVDAFYEWYGAVHRGCGFKSELSTEVYEQARRAVAAFVGADDEERAVIFVRNTTEAINRCADTLALGEGDVVLTTLMEHHSNLLPWRRGGARCEHVAVDAEGRPRLDDLAERLARHGGRVALVAVSGASNVTGVVPDLCAVARLAHEAGAMLLVDAAQLAPHRPIDMGRPGDDASIDFLALSAHKMYAPLGCGALIGPRGVFEQRPPVLAGGGAVLFVSRDDVLWADLPDREEAGSPNVIGAVALAAATTLLSRTIGWDALVAHERDLTAYALDRLASVPGLTVVGPRRVSPEQDRVGVISFAVEGFHHGLVGVILSREHAIGVRTGCFCAQPYIAALSGVPDERVRALGDAIAAGDKRDVPGLVRISFGFYNRREDVDATVLALQAIVRREWRGRYRQSMSGAYVPDADDRDGGACFSLDGEAPRSGTRNGSAGQRAALAV